MKSKSIFGLLMNPFTRIAGWQAFGLGLIFILLMGFFPTAPDMSGIFKDPYVILQSASFVIMMVLSLPVMVWSIMLIYKALKVSCDLKGSTLTLAFIIGLFVSEIIVKILIHFL